MGLLNTWIIVTGIEELNFSFYLISINLNLNCATYNNLGTRKHFGMFEQHKYILIFPINYKLYKIKTQINYF